ncbi:hypothetical protein D3C84_547990 [compost metagenome]
MQGKASCQAGTKATHFQQLARVTLLGHKQAVAFQIVGEPFKAFVVLLAKRQGESWILVSAQWAIGRKLTVFGEGDIYDNQALPALLGDY